MSVLKKKKEEKKRTILRLLGIRGVSLSNEESFLLFWGFKKYFKNERTAEASLKNIQFRIQKPCWRAHKLLAIWVSAGTLMQAPCFSGKQLTAIKALSILKDFPCSWYQSPLGGNI